MAIYSGTFGFIITINTGVDLTNTTDLILRIKSPSSTTDKSLTVSNIVEPKTSGKLTYTVQDGDFPVGGKYQMQVFDVTAGRRLASTISLIDVKQSL